MAADFGTQLREARLRQGRTLSQIAQATKISTATLLNIERNEIDRLPAGIFRKGYLRAYAAEVGIDPQDVVHAYVQQCPEVAAEELPFVRPPAIDDRQTGRQFLVIAAAVVVAVSAYSLLTDSDRPPVIPSLELVRTSAPLDPMVTDSTWSGARMAPAYDGGLYLEIEPAGPCWVSVVSDGTRVVYRLLESGERLAVEARNELVLRVGRPEAFGYTLNGVPGRPLGLPGQPVTVRITSDNYETFLEDSTPAVRRAVAPGVTRRL